MIRSVSSTLPSHSVIWPLSRTTGRRSSGECHADSRDHTVQIIHLEEHKACIASQSNHTTVRCAHCALVFHTNRRAGALEALLENALAEDASAETRSACVFSLANLAAPPKYHNLFIPAVPHLLHLLDSYDQVQRV